MRAKNPRTRSSLSIPITSLLWPAGKGAPVSSAPQWEHDLGLGDLVQAFASDRRHIAFIRQTLIALTIDPDVIAWRQAVLNDLLNNAPLVAQMQMLLPNLSDLRVGHAQLGGRKRSLLLETSDRLAELDVYLMVVQDLFDALQAASLDSAGLQSLRDSLQTLLNDPSFVSLREEMPSLRAPLQHIASLTVGVNLDTQLRPVSVVLMAINDHKMAEPASLLSRLIGTSATGEDETGIAPLHHVPDDPAMRPLSQLFQDLDRLITQAAQPVARALGRYVQISSAPLLGLENEFAFYVGAVAMIKRLQQRGIMFCQPEIAPLEDRITHVEGLVNLSLALRQPEKPIPSNVDFDDHGRIAILSGPNSGGKTTYVQSVGLAHVMLQAGLLIPAQSARVSPVDLILTHFPALETRQQGRLAEEAERLREVFRQATPHSLVLLNESLSSTSFGEALYLAQDILAALRSIGLRAIYATHLVELVDHMQEIEASASGASKLFSLVAGIRLTDDANALPTFEITRGLPLGRSYAQEIARRYGISLEQILQSRRDGNE